MSSCSPRWETLRTSGRDTRGPAALRISKALGHELMPWQRHVFDVALELDDDGQFVYRDVTLTVPRQQGKSLALLVLILTRCLLAPNQHVAYAAQSALDAGKKLRDDWMPLVRQSKLAPVVSVRYAPGDMGMRFPGGSRQSIVASTEKSIHGSTLDLGILDEAFAYDDARVEQGMRPAMSTRSHPDYDYFGQRRGSPRFDRAMLGAQFWVVSTAGTPQSSPYLLERVERGRMAVDRGVTDGLCYFEWSAPDDADPEDPATWRACMPALGDTVDEATVRAAHQSMSRSEFARAYLNRWVTAMGDPIVSLDLWQNLARPAAELPGWVVLGVDVAPHDKHAAIVAVGDPLDDGGLQSTVLESGVGTDWLLDALGKHVERYGNPHVMLDGRACAHLLPEIERVCGFDRITALNTVEIAAACQFWLRLVQDGKLRHRGEQELVSALTGAGQRSLADGWAWSRVKSGVDISPLVAQTLAASFWLGSWEA